MELTVITYISLLISLVSLGVSIYALNRVKSKKPSPKVEIPSKTLSIPLSTVPQTAPIAKVITQSISKTDVTVDSAPIIHTPKNVTPITEHPPTKKVVVNSCSDGQNGNEWYLEATGAEGTKFSIQVEWSDGTSDIVFHGVVPVELEFSHPKGVIPVKVIGIPPYGDVGVSYLWELNGFHWS